MTNSFENPSQEVIVSYLRQAQTVAIVGLSDRTETTSYMVAQILQQVGFKVIPINPRLAGQELLGETVYATIKDVPEHIDIVNVFRRSEFLPEVARDFIATDADVFWAQLGLKSDEAAQILIDNGRDKIVMDKCIKIEYANSDL